MGRILAIDYGLKRCGLAVTDPLKIIATPLTTVDTPVLLDYLKSYIVKESVERILIGLPLRDDGNDTHITQNVKSFGQVLRKHFPTIPLEYADESRTSIYAAKALFDAGIKKSKRRDKKLLDTVSATLILQDYLEEHP